MNQAASGGKEIFTGHVLGAKKLAYGALVHLANIDINVMFISIVHE